MDQNEDPIGIPVKFESIDKEKPFSHKKIRIKSKSRPTSNDQISSSKPRRLRD